MADHPPVIQEDGGALISKEQLELHKKTEWLGLLSVPLLLWIATRPRKLYPVEKGLLGVSALMMFVVDGYFLSRYQTVEKEAEDSSLAKNQHHDL